MTKRVLIAAGLAAILAGGSAAIAQSEQPGPGIHKGGRHARAARGGPGGFPGAFGLRGVDLTEAQRDQVSKIMESHKAEFQQVGEKLRAAHRAFGEAVRAETVDEAAIRARSADVATAMAEEAILRAKVRAEVSGILTAEQLQKSKELRPGRKQR